MAIRAFLSGLVDYAGLFPPAGLELPAAVGNYREYAGGEDRFLLGRFVIPASRLGELEPHLPSSGGDPMPLSVILADPEREAAAVRGFIDRTTPLARVQALEARLPVALTADFAADRIADHVRRAGDALGEAGLGDRVVFWEADLSRISAAAEGIAGAGGGPRGLKIRCGGPEPHAAPAPGRVAAAIAACREEGLPFKATAGLHHPLPGGDAERGTASHGFLNVFGAGVLAAARRIRREEILAILVDGRRESFRFEGGRFSYRGISATAEEVLVARHSFATSFGSCSFDEPRDDLRDLGYLPGKEPHA